MPPVQKARLMDDKLNYNVYATAQDRFGIIASGKAFNDTRQALHDLGLDVAAYRHLGIRLHKVSVVWPLEASSTRDFALGLQEIQKGRALLCSPWKNGSA